jgi:hypothetical protein
LIADLRSPLQVAAINWILDSLNDEAVYLACGPVFVLSMWRQTTAFNALVMKV